MVAPMASMVVSMAPMASVVAPMASLASMVETLDGEADDSQKCWRTS